MLYFKSCPRCTGDLYEQTDHYGFYKACLQCGNLIEPPNPVALEVLRAEVRHRVGQPLRRATG